MLEFLSDSGYMPHGYCLLWHPLLILVYGGSDVLIFLAYSAIPFALMRFIRLRPGLGYNHLLVLFASFILLCGLTHLLSFFTLWTPIYVELAAVKLMTALVSLTTAAVLFPLVPKLARIPSPAQLQSANEGLREALAANERATAELEEAREQLERKVARRTAELEEANAHLALVVRETAHRGKNLLTVVQALARQTARNEPDKEAFIDRFGERLSALAAATETLVRRGDREVGELSLVVESQLEPYLKAFPDRISVEGPPVQIQGEAAQQIALAMHELATNAVKHGALSTPEGRIALAWTVAGEGDAALLELTWRETGAPASAPDPEGRSGFGTLLLERAAPAQLGGEALREIRAEGLLYRLTVPVERLRPEAV